QHHRVLVPAEKQAGERTPVGGPDDVGGVLRLNAARWLQDALQQVLAPAQLADGRQVRTDRRAPVADLVTAAAVEGFRPEQLFAAAAVALNRQKGPGPRRGAKFACRGPRLG